MKQLTWKVGMSRAASVSLEPPCQPDAGLLVSILFRVANDVKQVVRHDSKQALRTACQITDDSNTDPRYSISNSADSIPVQESFVALTPTPTPLSNLTCHKSVTATNSSPNWTPVRYQKFIHLGSAILVFPTTDIFKCLIMELWK